MNTLLRRVSSAVSPLALLIALLALVASAAGAGYAAGQIGTNQIKNSAITSQKIKKNAVTTKKIKKNAVTGDKIKDGTVAITDLPGQEAQHAATLSNGGEGDCVWQGGASLFAGLGSPTFRKDRFGTVHLTGLAIVSDGAGGDGVCNGSAPGQTSDAIAFTLPAGYIPAKTLLVGGVSGGTLIVGAAGLTTPGATLPPGAVAANSSGDPVILDNVSFEPAGSGVVIPKMAASGRINVSLLKTLGLG